MDGIPRIEKITKVGIIDLHLGLAAESRLQSPTGAKPFKIDNR